LIISTSWPENTEKIKIAPMLLLPLLENSFKHGKSQNGQAFVDLSLEVNEEKINFTLKNSREEHKGISNLKSSGIGLTNIKKRLQLLYPELHSFYIEKEQDYFLVQLQIKTKKS
jgi:sensor histidine kinase YesM